MPVAYDNYIKKPNQELEYTAEMIKEMDKCSKDPEYFFNNYLKIQHPDRGKIPMILYPHQKRMLESIHNNRMSIIKTPRQYGKTSFCAAYILWFVCFNSEKTTGVVSNLQASAIEILDRMKVMYEDLCPWMKPGVHNYAKTMISFDNGSRVIASATSKNSFRGWTLNGICLCDEFCHVAKNMQAEFWSSNYPTVSSSKHAKMILISTPLGMYDLFHTIWLKAENNKNKFNPIDVHWSEHPERDKKWLEEQKEALGDRLFRQEVLVQFLGSTNTVIDANALEILLNKTKDPITHDLNDRLRIWEKPQEGHQYVLGIDNAKGTGEHDSTIQVLKISSYTPFKAEQVAVFQDNYTDIYEFSNIVHRTAIYYNNAHIMCENNAEGSTVVNKIWWDFEYGNLVNESDRSTGLGIRSTTRTKPRAVLAMKKLIESNSLIINDIYTVNQLTSFIDKGNNKFVGKDLLDDLVDALFWGTYVTEFDVLNKDIKIDDGIDEDDEAWGVLTDVIESNEYYDNDFGWMDKIHL